LLLYCPIPQGWAGSVRHSHTKRSFRDLSLRQRRDAFVSERWKISVDRDAPGIFTTDAILPGSYADVGVFKPIDGPNLHARCHFVSKLHARQGWIYHAFISTPGMEIIQALEKTVDERVDSLLARAGLLREDVENKISMIRAPGSKNNPAWEFKEVAPPSLPMFGGKTLPGVVSDVMGEMSQSLWPAIYYGVSEMDKCRRGIDIKMVVDEDHLDVAAVVRQIQKFWENGEKFEQGAQISIGKYIASAEDFLARGIRSNAIEDLEYRSLDLEGLEE
jgi:hypothetical protein